LAFATGAHQCAGLALARSKARCNFAIPGAVSGLRRATRRAVRRRRALLSRIFESAVACQSIAPHLSNSFEASRR